METRGDQALSKVFKPLCGDKERYRDKDDREDRAQIHSLEYMRLHELFESCREAVAHEGLASSLALCVYALASA